MFLQMIIIYYKLRILYIGLCNKKQLLIYQVKKLTFK